GTRWTSRSRAARTTYQNSEPSLRAAPARPTARPAAPAPRTATRRFRAEASTTPAVRRGTPGGGLALSLSGWGARSGFGAAGRGPAGGDARRGRAVGRHGYRQTIRLAPGSAGRAHGSSATSAERCPNWYDAVLGAGGVIPEIPAAFGTRRAGAV